MKFANATNLNRKSGVAQWRDLRFLFRFSRRLFSPTYSQSFMAKSNVVGGNID
jgi:hypothetical protein